MITAVIDHSYLRAGDLLLDFLELEGVRVLGDLLVNVFAGLLDALLRLRDLRVVRLARWCVL